MSEARRVKTPKGQNTEKSWHQLRTPPDFFSLSKLMLFSDQTVATELSFLIELVTEFRV